MDLRYFELHDLLCEAAIALEGGRGGAAADLVRKALRWIEADWLATPGEIRAGSAVASSVASGADEEDDD